MGDVAEHPNTGPVEFLKNGTVRIVLDGNVIRLRRPKVAEFRRIRENLDEVNDEIRRHADALSEESMRLSDEVAELAGGADKSLSELDSETRQAIRKMRAEGDRLSRDFRDLQEDLRYQWFHDVVATLSQDGPLDIYGEYTDDGDPAEDGDAANPWPVPGPAAEPWMASPDTIAELIKHWQTVPLARGGR